MNTRLIQKSSLTTAGLMLTLWILNGCTTGDAGRTVQTHPDIRTSDTQAHVNYLASDELEGRMTASPGIARAGDYIARHFKAAGLKPAGDGSTFFQSFPYKQGKCRNVIGLIPPTGGSDEYVMIGGHYDHLGMGDSNSLADKSDAGQIHNGADDNASGTSLVMELAEACAWDRKNSAASGPRRGVIFACWSGEEMGIIGSSYYASHPTVPLEKTVAYLNFDMVGVLRDNKLVVQGVGSSPDWKRLLEKRNVAAGFNLVLQDDPYQPTDMTALYPVGVPVLGFFTGAHEHYHKPSDDVDKVNFEGITQVAEFAKSILDSLLSDSVRLAYAKVEMKPVGMGPRRVSTGTIPDYASNVTEGMKLSGVKAGGPAEKAGLQAGDVILVMDGHDIKDVQGYSDVLGKLEPGKTVEIVILRGQERRTLQITPIEAGT